MKKKTIVLCCTIVIFLAGNIFQFWSYNYANKLPVDAVPNAATALKITDAVWFSISKYGVFSEEHAVIEVTFDILKNSWKVSGRNPGYLDGCFTITIRKSDGKILHMGW